MDKRSGLMARGPVLIEIDDDAPAASVADAPPVPDTTGDGPQGVAMRQAARLAARRPSGLLCAFLAVLAIICLREIAALGRLSRVDALRREADTALEENDLAAARRLSAQLVALYAGRGETRWRRSMRWPRARSNPRRGRWPR